ncbi:DegT/DnrJ/EryC1/StrS family aminotransferase [Kibdelosporangium persicum]|nr:DegT/DnrJ/EryC1/StrS family aminotransferase [Kibdelosporangium persicum]
MTGIASARTALACNGGPPVRDPARPWPRWPAPSQEAERNLLHVLHGDRWTLTAPLGRAESFERRFARMFARYTGTRHCVPVDHGSSALVIALESLGLRPADRVLVPALTWTASASAALRAGLVPVLVDVDPVTGCVGPDDLDLDVDARAVVAVHWSCAMADIPAIADVADRHGMVVVEDCAQAHGAEWQGRRAGSMGRIGCFSMQQGKVLTCGEGGAVVTDDDALAPRLEELRADSRRHRSDSGRPGEQELVETGSIMGVNFCLGEFQAAVLCAQLEILDRQHEVRARNFAVLAALVDEIPGVRLLRPAPAQTRMSIYEVPFVFDRLPEGMTNADIARALTAELHTSFYITDTPLHVTPLLRPWTKSTLAPLADQFVALHRDRTFPNASRFYEHSVVTHHSTLLGSEPDMADIAAAVAKVAALVQD